MLHIIVNIINLYCRCAPPRIPSGFFSWIMVVLRLKTSYALPIVGVDAEVVMTIFRFFK